MEINVRVHFALLLLGFGMVFYIGLSTSPIIVFVFSVCSISFIFSIYPSGFLPRMRDLLKWLRSMLAYITVATLLLGALCSGIAGYVGMWVSVRATVGVCSAARCSARKALQVATHAGGFSAIVVVGMAVIGIAILYAIFYVWLGVDTSVQ